MKFDVVAEVEKKKDLLIETADYIWDHPELGFKEFQCAQKLQEVLRAEGFQLETGLGHITTAFSGRFGSGRPVIGILGEFDALMNLSQKAGVTHQESAGGLCGHGCGHNLLGVGSLGAALAVKAYLETTGASGTVIYFGCPAEENGSAKAFLARDGVFDALDAALSWHPADTTGVRNLTTLANCKVLYRFDGVAAHASIQPHLGRSALDAVELMNVGANFLREHVIDAARIHYAVTDAGGDAPNVVQSHAEVLYLMRAPQNADVADIYERVNNIAAGAALMTGTTVSRVFIKGCSNTVLNQTIECVLYKYLLEIGAPQPDAADLAFARKMTEEALGQFPNYLEHPLHYEVKPYDGSAAAGKGSTYVGDVSWVCPTAQIMAATHTYGTPNHSWQQVAQGKAPLAHKTMLFVSKVLAATAVELMADPALLEQARQEHRKRIGKGYICPIPPDVRPGTIPHGPQSTHTSVFSIHLLQLQQPSHTNRQWAANQQLTQ